MLTFNVVNMLNIKQFGFGSRPTTRIFRGYLIEGVRRRARGWTSSLQTAEHCMLLMVL